MMIDHDDDKPNLSIKTLVVFIAVAGACLALFWVPLVHYTWHWWLG